MCEYETHHIVSRFRLCKCALATGTHVRGGNEQTKYYMRHVMVTNGNGHKEEKKIKKARIILIE